MLEQKKYKELPVGAEAFKALIESNKYFVDKTTYIKTVIEEGSDVLLLTRPRRFGKTLFMNMLADFVRINKDNPNDKKKTKALFKDTIIFKDQEFTDKYLGNFPVINISLKSVDATSYKKAYGKLADVTLKLATKNSFLLDSDRVSDFYKSRLKKLTNESFLKNEDNESNLTSSISDICQCLYSHYGRRVLVLIDEYDVPLAKAAEKGYHEDMVSIISSYLGFLKYDPNNEEDDKTIYKIIMTGCLKVAKNSIFTGVNNLKVNTVVSENKAFSGIIGFTKEETLKVLEDYEMQDYAQVVKNNYDGYRFYDKEMFCPWDVINFVDDNYCKHLNGNESIKTDNYWAASTSSTAVYEYLGYLTDKDTQKMQDLVDGKSISFKLNESMNYDCLSEHNSDDFWSLLLHTGYLTKEWDKSNTNKIIDNSSDSKVSARIPNLEILNCFTKNIQDRFKNKIAPSSVAEQLANYIFEGDADSASDTIFNLLQNYVSIRDNATRAPHENFYHGFLNGLFANCSKDFFSEYHSNYEVGAGYADIIFINNRGNKVAILEIKTCKEKESRISRAKEAIAQIEEKHYAKSFIDNEDITTVQAIGISFLGKNCHVSVKGLK